MKKIIEFFDENSGLIKMIMIIALAMFLISSGVLNWFQDKWNEDLSLKNDILQSDKVDLQRTIKSLHAVQEQAQVKITELHEVIDSLEKAYKLKTAEMHLQESEYEKEIERIKYIPADTIYMDLLKLYPDPNSQKEYPFTARQTRNFYTNHVRLQYSLKVNIDLGVQVNNLRQNTNTKESVIINKNIQIGSLKTELTTSRNYVEKLEQQNNLYEKSYKSERLTKNIWQGVAGAEFLTILYLILGN